MISFLHELCNKNVYKYLIKLMYAQHNIEELLAICQSMVPVSWSEQKSVLCYLYYLGDIVEWLHVA